MKFAHSKRRPRLARANQSPRRSQRLIEALEGRALLAADGLSSGWHNPLLAEDVNGDAEVTPADVLTVLDAINRMGVGPLSATGSGSSNTGGSAIPLLRATSIAAPTPGSYLDVTGDGILAPDDVLRVLDEVNRGLVGGGIAASATGPFISVSDATVAEESGSMTFTVSLSEVPTVQVLVGYSTQDNTAVAGLDYTAQTGQLTFEPGVTQLQVTVPITDDTLSEPDETFFLVISSPVNGQIFDDRGVGTILASDGGATTLIETRFEVRDASNNVIPDGGSINVGDHFTLLVYVNDVSGNNEGVMATYLDVVFPASVLEALGPFSYDALYDSARQGSFATDGLLDEAGASNFNGAPGPGEVLLFSIPMTAEAAGVALLAGNQSDLPGNEAAIYPTTTVAPEQIYFDTYTLNVEEVSNSLSIDSVTHLEGDSGTTTFTFTVTRNNPTPDVATVQFTTVDGTATLVDNDYVATSGTLVFGVGETSKTITVLVNGDSKIETDETFSVVLSGPSNAVLGTAKGTGTILNDDEVPTLSGYVYVDANNDGIRAGSEFGLPGVIVTIANADGTFSDWTTTDGTGHYEFQNLAADRYYITEIQPGFYADGKESPQALVSQNDQFYIDLFASSSIGDLNFGETGILTEFLAAALNRRIFFSTSLNDPVNHLGSPIVNANLTKGDLWVSFDAGWDGLRKMQAYFTDGNVQLKLYDLNRFGKLHLLATSTLVNGIPEISWVDAPDAPAKPLFLQITGTSTNASVKIIDTLRVVTQSVPEGNTGTTAQTITVRLSAPQTAAVVVNYATANDAASSPDDFTAVNGTLTFAPGEVEKTFTVQIKGDTLDEDNETFLVNLSGASSFVEVAPSPFKIAITDDDQMPKIKITDAVVSEGNAGSTTAVFNIILSEKSGRPVTVDYSTASGTATSGGDFTPVSGTVTIEPGTLAKSITVSILGDTFLEADETFNVILSNAVNASILDGVAVGTILNDDAGSLFLPPPGAFSGGVLASVESSSAPVTGSTNAVPAASTTPATIAGGFSRPVSSRGRVVTKAVDTALAEVEDWLLV